MTENNVRPLTFLDNGGKMGKLMREKDWSNTTVGTPDTWPQSLRTAVNLILNSKFPDILTIPTVRMALMGIE